MMETTKSIIKRILPKRTRVRLREWQLYFQGFLPRLMSWPLRSLFRNAEDALPYVFESVAFTPELIVRGYYQGLFCKPDSTGGALRFFDPDPRGIMPIADFHVPTNLGRIVRQHRFEIRVDTDYQGVLLGCADRETTWITPEIIDGYLELHGLGVAHSVEAWQNGQLVGGLIGMAFGSYFVTESLFHRVTHASKVTWVHLNQMLEAGGFVLHDVQWTSRFNRQFGAFDMPRAEFKYRLARALIKASEFPVNRA
jgi:leucyl/phenylalanyl-tRNA--protein transferase